MRHRTGAIVALGVAAAIVLGIAGSADASLTSAPYGTPTVPGPRPRPAPRPQPAVPAVRSPRPTPLPAPGARPHPRETRVAWARNSVEVAGI